MNPYTPPDDQTQSTPIRWGWIALVVCVLFVVVSDWFAEPPPAKTPTPPMEATAEWDEGFQAYVDDIGYSDDRHADWIRGYQDAARSNGELIE